MGKEIEDKLGTIEFFEGKPDNHSAIYRPFSIFPRFVRVFICGFFSHKFRRFMNLTDTKHCGIRIWIEAHYCPVCDSVKKIRYEKDDRKSYYDLERKVLWEGSYNDFLQNWEERNAMENVFKQGGQTNGR